jgi:aromatic ring-opening dioxygenase catalytic subunit (LigB family)
VRAVHERLQEIMRPLKEAEKMKMLITVQSHWEITQAHCVIVRMGVKEVIQASRT